MQHANNKVILARIDNVLGVNNKGGMSPCCIAEHALGMYVPGVATPHASIMHIHWAPHSLPCHVF